MQGPSFLLATLALGACAGAGTPAPAPPAAAPSGHASPDELALAYAAALGGGDPAAVDALFPPRALVRDLCQGEPEPLIAAIYEFHDLVAGSLAELDGATFDVASVTVPSEGDIVRNRWAIDAGGRWLGAWDEQTQDGACTVTRPIEVVEVGIDFRATEGTQTMGCTFLQADGRWYLLNDLERVPRQLTEEDLFLLDQARAAEGAEEGADDYGFD